MHCILFNHFDAHLVDFEEPTTRVWEWCCWYGLFRMRLACVGCISLVWHPSPHSSLGLVGRKPNPSLSPPSSLIPTALYSVQCSAVFTVLSAVQCSVHSALQCSVHRTRCGRWKEIEATCVPPPLTCTSYHHIIHPEDHLGGNWCDSNVVQEDSSFQVRIIQVRKILVLMINLIWNIHKDPS